MGLLKAESIILSHFFLRGCSLGLCGGLGWDVFVGQRCEHVLLSATSIWKCRYRAWNGLIRVSLPMWTPRGAFSTGEDTSLLCVTRELGSQASETQGWKESPALTNWPTFS